VDTLLNLSCGRMRMLAERLATADVDQATFLRNMLDGEISASTDEVLK
jgi:hypothetical protein